MDPEMAKLAMEQMSKMTPQQMEAMRAQMGSMDPQMMQAAMAQMNSMSEADKARMREQLANMDPSNLEAMRSAGNMRFSAVQDYELKGSMLLKDEGNDLHKQGKFREAAEKYKRAHSNMAAHTSQEGRNLRKVCALNLASCHLRLGQEKEAIPLCTEVIDVDPSNIKARYRRGQAHSAIGNLEEAVKDLQVASHASPSDQAIADKLTEVREELKKRGKPVPPPPSTLPRPPAPVGSVTPSTPSSPPIHNPAMAAQMLKDPATRKMMSEMMKNLSDDDLRNMARMSGAPPGMSIEAMRKQYEMMDSMNEDDIDRMVNMQAGGASSSTPRPSSTPPIPPMDKISQLQSMMSNNPDMMKQMMDTISNMSQEQLDAMAKASGAPSGMKLTPEMIKMSTDMMSKMSPAELEAMAKMRAEGANSGTSAHAAPAPSSSSKTVAKHDDVEIEDITDHGEAVNPFPPSPNIPPGMASMAASMMSNMTPEDMQQMASMARTMGGMGGPGGVTPDQAARIQQQMLGNPESMKMIQNMMKSMDPKTLAALSKQAGMEMSEDQAAKMAEAMKSMKPEHMEKLFKVAGYAQQAKQKVVEVKDFLFSKSVFWISLLMLALAIVLRYTGWM